jgi:hypothetical protein
MTTFDKLYSTILGEEMNQNQSSVPTPQTTPVQPSNPQEDQELLKMLQQKLNDQKFKDALLKMLNSPTTPTATNSVQPNNQQTNQQANQQPA